MTPQEIAAAIRRGIAMRPKQAFREFFVGNDASCALGAAFDGFGTFDSPEALASAVCCSIEGYVSVPSATGEHRTRCLDDAIAYLNDERCWSRERIADWLETLDPQQEA